MEIKHTLAVQMFDVNFYAKEVIPNTGKVFFGNTFWDIVEGMTVHNPFCSGKSKRMYAKQTLKGIGILDCDLPHDEREACRVFVEHLIAAGYAGYVIRAGKVVPPWKWDEKRGEPVLKIRKKRVVTHVNVSEKYSESSRRNLIKSHESRRANPELAREIAIKASAAAKAKLTPEDRKRICAKARAVRLLKRETMTAEERDAQHQRRLEATQRGWETRRRRAAEATEKLNRKQS